MMFNNFLKGFRSGCYPYGLYQQKQLYKFPTVFFSGSQNQKVCLYKTLNVSTDATLEEIKKSYKELAKKYHPDVTSGQTVQEEKFKEISQAYSILSDEQKRQKYDLENGIISGSSYDKASSTFENDSIFNDYSAERRQKNVEENSEQMDEYFKNKYFNNPDFYASRDPYQDSEWHVSRKLYNTVQDRKDRQKQTYMGFNLDSEPYFDYRDQSKSVFQEGKTPIKFVHIAGFFVVLFMVSGKTFLEEYWEKNFQKHETKAVEKVTEGKGIKQKIMPLNIV